MFRKPKKTALRTVFSGYSDDENEVEVMDVAPKTSSSKSSRNSKKSVESKVATTLLSFGHEEEDEGEVFQVKKSSQSKKLMKQLDKERRKKKKELASSHGVDSKSNNGSMPDSTSKVESKTTFSNKIQTEIRTDDFVLVVKKSETPNVILNGRDALCAGKNDLSSEDEDAASGHTYSKPDAFKMVLESGAIPDAAMIHAARKRRQKARELGDYVPIDDNREEESVKGKRIEETQGDGSEEDEEDRVDMSDIKGHRDIEERRQKFDQAQEYIGDESDAEIYEWENQQIRKGVTGSQLQSAQSEAPFYLTGFAGSFTNSAKQAIEAEPKAASTAELLKEAYARSSIIKAKYSTESKHSAAKSTAPKTPIEILEKLHGKLRATKEANKQHGDDIDSIAKEMIELKFEIVECAQTAPISASKYKFYQEIRCYLQDLVECYDEKLPQITVLEVQSMSCLSKYSKYLIERRRQDIRDQAKDLADASKSTSAVRKNDAEDHARMRRTAEREGRRTRRRRDREKSGMNDGHLDGMSSDDEISDQDFAQYIANLNEIRKEADKLLDDTAIEFAQVHIVLSKIAEWKRFHPDTYNEAFVQLCLPKILHPLIRIQLICWNPLNEECEEIESMKWYENCMNYAIEQCETEEGLFLDTDSRLVPTIIEKAILPKLNDLVENVWDPMSTAQTFRLVKLISRLGRDYPSIRPTCKILRVLFNSIQDKIKLSVENDVFIPLFPKQVQEAKSSFFQRQFCSGAKLFRNILSWQGILGDETLKQLAILSLLNRYLLLAMRACSSPVDATSKAAICVYTLPRVWLSGDSSVLESLEMFISALHHIYNKLDQANPQHIQAFDSLNKIMKSLYVVQTG